MKLLVTGCGSGGTNLAIEFVRSLNHFNLSGSPEDKGFLHNLKKESYMKMLPLSWQLKAIQLTKPPL